MSCKSIDFLYSNGKLVPKRINANWLQKHHPLVYSEIMECTKGYPELSLYQRIYLWHMQYSTIPLCVTCKKNPISLQGSLLSRRATIYCSNRCAILSKETQEKTAMTCKKRYGQRFKSRKEKYNFGEHHTQKNIVNIDDIYNHDFMQRMLETYHWKDIAKHFNLTTKSHSSTYNFLRKFGYEPKLISGYSYEEKEIVKYIQSLNEEIEIIENTKKIITPYELDIFLPAYNLAIEYCGTYWHSSGSKETENPMQHLNKLQLCEEMGIQLLTIFDTDDIDIWKSMIAHKLGFSKKIYARNCFIKNISTNEYRNFLDINHLQGYSNSKYKLGLFSKNDCSLMAVLGIGKSRFNTDEIELIRYAVAKNHTVVGGLSKLLKKIDCKKLISYANRRWCNSKSNVYSTIGFEPVKVTAPNYFWLDRVSIYTRQSFQKHKLKHRLKSFDESLSEAENMYNNGYRRIWDCGNIKYENNSTSDSQESA